MQTLNTAQTVLSMLEVNGIDTLYCLPGVQNDPFFDALYDRTNAIRPIHARHEQACAYMALGHAMATGKPSAMEESMLDFAEEVEPNSRLSCQIRVSDALDGLIVRLPANQH